MILAYLLPWMMEKLIPQFEECPPGTRIVSHDFEIQGVQADEVVDVPLNKLERHRVRLYTTPLKKLPETRPWKLKQQQKQ